VVLHVEFQRKHDDEMDRRVWEYNCLASIHTGLTVYSVVIYLVKDSAIVDPPYEVHWPTGLTVHRFVFENIKLWEIPGEMLKEQNLSGLLPLLPLTKEGKCREVVEETIECIQQAGKPDLLPLLYAFSALIFTKKNEQRWLKERFDLMGDILETSWAYKEMMQKGVAKGLAQGLKQGLKKEKKDMEHVVVRLVEFRFPALVPLAKQQAIKAKNPQKLKEMIDRLFLVKTENEARAVLLGEQE
jgi:hypothetical protein